MKLLKKKQVLFITGAVVLFFLLLFANTKAPIKANDNTQQKQGAAEVSLDNIINEAILDLASDQKELLTKLEAEIVKADDTHKLLLLDSLVKMSVELKSAELAAHYEQEIALKKQTPESWLKAGNRFYTATSFAKEENKTSLYQAAIDCFSKVIEADPTNNDAKVNLAVCYVETTDPMKGISMLKEVLGTDSTNINASFKLGTFAIRSGQYAKAIEHFSRVLKINPAYYETYLYMAEAYEKDGNKIKAIESLEKYATFVNDITIKTEVQNYINKLKNS